MPSSQKVLPFVIFFLPFQFNKYFFTNSSLVFGIPIDYRALAIYLSDIFIVAHILLTIFELKNMNLLYRRYRAYILCLASLNIYIFLVNMFSNESKIPPTYFSFKLIEFSLFSIAMSLSFAKKNTFNSIKKFLAATTIIEGVIITLQFTWQKTLGLWFLGERLFDANTPSIAHVYIFEKQLLRAYGTFPHPNVAACFILVSQIIFLSKNINSKQKLKQFEKVFIGITTIALVLTFSKIAILLEIILLAFILRKTKFLIPLIMIPIVIFIKGITQTAFVYSLSERIELLQASLNISLQNPLFGVGSLNFISRLAQENIITNGEVRLLQPVHNVFFLILSENGLIGLALFILLLFSVQKNLVSLTKTLLFLLLLVYLSVDHFLWTLQQGQIILFLSLAYIIAVTKNRLA